MNLAKENLRELLEQQDPLGLDNYIRILYEACESRPYCNDADIRRVREVLEAHLSDMEFRRQDGILCAVNELCAQYDYAGFSEGFQRGAELVLELTEKV